MEKTEEIITSSFEETQLAGEQLAYNLKGKRVIALHGDLGNGKTTFVQGFARGLGVEKRIISPTFVIVRKYALKEKNFYHIDLYRVQASRDIEGLGLKEILEDENSIVAIEWPEKIENILPKDKITIEFFQVDENTRKIVLHYE